MRETENNNTNMIQVTTEEKSMAEKKDDKKKHSFFRNKKQGENDALHGIKPTKKKKVKPVKEKKVKPVKEKKVKPVKEKKAKPSNSKEKRFNIAKIKRIGVNFSQSRFAVFVKTIVNNRGIRTKLISAFLIPAILFIVVGIMIYSKSKLGLTENSENLINTNVQMLKQYFELGFENIELSATRLSVNENVVNYYSGGADEKSDLFTRYRAGTKSAISNESTADTYILNVMTFAKNGQGCTQTGIVDDDMYNPFVDGGDGKAADDSGSAWISTHKSIDEILGNESSDYAMSYVKTLMSSRNKSVGYIVIDVKQEFVKKILDDASISKNSIKGFITSDGKEVISGSDKFSFTKQKFYKDIKNCKKGGYNYVDYNGKSYLFVYDKVGDAESLVCALVPKSEIIEKANDIGKFIIVTVILCFLIAIALGSVLAAGIAGSIKKVNVIMKQTSEGDLTGKLKMKRKDEFGILSRSIMNMIVSVKNIIIKMANVSSDVQSSANKVNDNSDVLLKATKDITAAVGYIEAGLTQQSADTDSCLNQMSDLADKITDVYSSTNEIGNIATTACDTIDNGMVIVEQLGERVKDTTEITQTVIDDINQLKEESKSINSIIKTIDDISDETNLLSLNASIEAARAGEAGRGFAVVSDEIRKLAEQSGEAGKQIGEIINNIQSRMIQTMETAGKAQGIVNYQQEALDNTVKIFKDIREQVVTLSTDLEDISRSISGIESAKNDTLEAIESISATSNETEAASSDLSKNAEKQLHAVEVLNEAVKRLKQNADDLDESVSVFKITEEQIENKIEDKIMK